MIRILNLTNHDISIYTFDSIFFERGDQYRAKLRENPDQYKPTVLFREALPAQVKYFNNTLNHFYLGNINFLNPYDNSTIAIDAPKIYETYHSQNIIYVVSKKFAEIAHIFFPPEILDRLYVVSDLIKNEKKKIVGTTGLRKVYDFPIDVVINFPTHNEASLMYYISSNEKKIQQNYNPYIANKIFELKEILNYLKLNF